MDSYQDFALVVGGMTAFVLRIPEPRASLVGARLGLSFPLLLALTPIGLALLLRGFGLSLEYGGLLVRCVVVLYEVDISLGWNTERESGLPAPVRYCEVATGDDVHPDYNV